MLQDQINTFQFHECPEVLQVQGRMQDNSLQCTEYLSFLAPTSEPEPIVLTNKNTLTTSKIPHGVRVHLKRTTSIIQIIHFTDKNSEGNFSGLGHSASQWTLAPLTLIPCSLYYSIFLKAKLNFHFFHDHSSSVKRHSTHYMTHSLGKCPMSLQDSPCKVPQVAWLRVLFFFQTKNVYNGNVNLFCLFLYPHSVRSQLSSSPYLRQCTLVKHISSGVSLYRLKPQL